ncbi:hypothetical protein LI291_10170 [Intestinibacillus massiliensis]|nr:hypothetical protein [Intestinibacillus massiliensis]
MIQIDGVAYDVGITDLQRGEKREYKYDLVAEDGTRRFETRARYRTYDVTLGSLRQSEYDALRRAAAAGGVLRVTLPDGQEEVTLEAQVELGADALGFIEADGTNRWDGLTLTVTGVRPLEDGQ